SRSIAENRQGAQILAAVKRGLELPASECPEPTPRRDLPSGIGPLIELLRVLLKMRCEDHDVAQKLIASADDLELIAADDGAAVPALHGWRREVFGEDALALKRGGLALGVDSRRVKLIPIAS
ncbi:MAG TPA: ribonuclease D, partial [Acetobacteraceae bacterium]